MTYGAFRSSLKAEIWPDGEASNLIASHDKSFIDALADIQTWAECTQQGNTDLFPHCATFYRCGLTIIDSAPRGFIKSVSVIDKLDPDTCKEDPAASDDWCSDIEYIQVEAKHVHDYFKMSNRRGCCLPIPLFFGIPGCTKGLFPVPTDEGLPEGLPVLPLGFRYPQTSTDRTWGRAGGGIWAMDRGQLFIAPWINSTETVVIKWDGIKRKWTDADPIDDDPLLAKAVRLYVQAQHAGEWDHEREDEGDFQGKYQLALAVLIRQCREESRVRGYEAGEGSSRSVARGSVSAGVTNLFYNDDQSASVTCPAGTTGSPVSVTIPAGTVGSAISKADADQKAADQAKLQATQQLVCTTVGVLYFNEPQTYTASCVQEEGAPIPEGEPVTVTVPAGELSSIVSQASANAAALALAQARAESHLNCLFWNSTQTAQVTCPTNGLITAESTVSAHTYSSSLSQDDADAKALAAATNAANQLLVDSGCVVGGGGGLFWNTEQFANAHIQCSVLVSGTTNVPVGGGGGGGGSFPGQQVPHVIQCTVAVQMRVPAHIFSSAISQANANSTALFFGNHAAAALANQKCAAGQCGNFSATYSGGVIND